jgi:small subunit ribosomal protein S21
LAEVRVQEGEPLENALRRFKRKVQQEDIIKEVKRHSYYLKPGEKRRVKAALARKRNRKKARKEQFHNTTSTIPRGCWLQACNPARNTKTGMDCRSFSPLCMLMIQPRNSRGFC